MAAVKPVPFEYAAPDELGDVLTLLASRGESTALLAGGQSLVAMLNLRILRPELVVDLNGVAGLDEIAIADDRLRIGAGVRLADLEQAAGLPSPLQAALRHVGHPQIRNRTTLGGNLAHADPASELPAVVVALDGTVLLQSLDGERLVPAEEFFVGPFTTARRPDEVITAIELPRMRGRGVFLEFARRPGDFAVAGVCVVAGGGDVRIGICGAAPKAMRARGAESALAAGADAASVATAAAAEVEPWDDVHATAEYRRDLVETLVRRAVGQVAA
jgi:carbon-monoxide dehydrogenase medium subunit